MLKAVEVHILSKLCYDVLNIYTRNLKLKFCNHFEQGYLGYYLNY